MTTRTKTKHPARRRALREWSASAPSGSPLVVDRERGVIEGVKVLGFRSRNSHGLKEATGGTEYTRRCMEKALPLYEGVDVLLNHDDSDDARGVEHVFGKLRNVRLMEDGIRADLHFNRKHKLAEMVCEDVESSLGAYGLSHDASAGKERFDPATRRLVIESLAAVRSVDLVRKPATNRNLWESHGDATMKTTLRQLLESLTLTKARKAWRKRLLEDDTIPGMDDPLEVDAADDGGDEAADPDAALKDGFDAACMACINSTDMTADEKIAKLKELLKAHEKLTQTAEPDAPDDDLEEDDDGDEDDDGELKEQVGDGSSKNQKGQIRAMHAKDPDDHVTTTKLGKKGKKESLETARLRHRLAVRDLCDELGVKGDKVLIEAAESLPDLAAARRLLEREKARGGSPRSEGGHRGTATAKLPATSTEFAASITD